MVIARQEAVIDMIEIEKTQSGPTWYKPYFGLSGVYYEVVQVP